jgi:hypothetical protein
VNFDVISKKKYKEISKLIVSLHPRVSDVKLDGTNVNEDEGDTVRPTTCVWKGNLCKKNWYGNK